MGILNRKITYIFIVIILLCNTTNLHAQSQIYQDDIPRDEISVNQDSILNKATNIREVWDSKQTNYFIKGDPNQKLRFHNATTDANSSAYKGFLFESPYKQENYRVILEDSPLWDSHLIPIIFTGKLFVGEYIQMPEMNKLLAKIYPLYDITKNKKFRIGLSDYQKQIRHKIYLNTILSNFKAVKYFPEDLAAYEVVKPEVVKVNLLKDLFSVENIPDFASVGAPAKHVTKRKYWTVTKSHQFQISEGYVSDNWYKGGVSNLNIQSNQKLTLNYKKGKIQNNNEIRWDLSMFTNPNDTLRETRIGNDLLRSYSDFGIEAGNNWSYSVNLELKTQLFNNYKENTTVKKAAFLSPFFMNVGLLGMKYELFKTSKENKNKDFKLTSDISPLSLKYTYVRDPEAVDPKGYGIPAGKNDTLIIGSMINATFKRNFNKGISFSSRLKCFTDYRKVEFESENELNMAINRYFSTKIYIYFRFDDSKGIVRDPKLGYWQLNQILSFGLNYIW